MKTCMTNTAMIACALAAAVCTAAQADVPQGETPRPQVSKPMSRIATAVDEYQRLDPGAAFTFFNGHVDSFSTSPKSEIPGYAYRILAGLGLSTKPEQPLKISAPVYSGETPKPARDLDADLDRKLPILPEQVGAVQQQEPRGDDDVADYDLGTSPKMENRTLPPENPQKLVDWKRPDDKTRKLQEIAAKKIFMAFTAQHRNLFELSDNDLELQLAGSVYQVGPYFRKLAFDQRYSPVEKILYGRTLVHFDVNWNVISVSRMIATPKKMKMTDKPGRTLSLEEAVDIAARAFDECRPEFYRVLRNDSAVDVIRRLRVADVELASMDGDCHWRTIIDRNSGKVVNVSDMIDRAYTDAQVNRWYFPNGDQFNPAQIVSTGIYTRNDRRLEHDFFYMMNDHRCEGAAESSCNVNSHNSLQCDEAHGTYDGDSYVRATRRTNRDFDNYYPWGSSEAFAETNAYYWSRSFSQWLKSSLDAMGVLPNSASDYPRVLMVTDVCRSGSVHNSSYAITTDQNKGEGTNVIRLAHRNPSGTSNHNAACEAGGCFDNPSNLHHELNHFFLKRYYGVGSDLDCGGANQLKFTHEGIIGTAVPQAYWHYYYGVGYDPSSTDRLYFSHSSTGRVHTDNSDRMTIGGNLCVDNTDDAYTAGRVVGQALWEFYHGNKVDGSTINSTWYPSTDRDFNVLVYWAADLQAASTYKDRYEYANRFMEILENHSNWSSNGKQEYCDIFEHHGLDPYITPSYCN